MVHRARSEHGHAVVGPFYEALGTRIFDSAPTTTPEENTQLDLRGTASFLAPILAELGLPHDLVDALDDDSLDRGLRSETDEALGLTGKDVGTPIIHFQPPTGLAFFGPVISRLPDEDEAVALWDHVIGLAAFPGFAEMKRSLRELPQLRGLGVDEGEVGSEEDWHGGSRRTKR